MGSVRLTEEAAKTGRSGKLLPTGHRTTRMLPLPLDAAYPVNAFMELTLSSPKDQVVRGVVYCTDDVSNSVVLRSSLTHTTLSSEVLVINASCISGRRTVPANDPNAVGDSRAAEDGRDAESAEAEDRGRGLEIGPSPTTAEEIELLSVPLPQVTRRALEERERRAMKLAEESLGQVNPNVGPQGQAVFDLLLKACNEVVWRGQAVLVLNQIRVDPPYGPSDCCLVGGGGEVDEAAARLNADSLERVKKIVAAGVLSPVASG